jgi:hypothetical protein
VGNRRSAERLGEDGKYAVVRKATGDCAWPSDTDEAAGRYVKCHGRNDGELSS